MKQHYLGTASTIQNIPYLVSSLCALGNYARFVCTSRAHSKEVFVERLRTEVKYERKQRKDEHARATVRAQKAEVAPPEPLAPQRVWDPSTLTEEHFPPALRERGAYYYAWVYVPKHAIQMVHAGLLDSRAATDGTHSTRVIRNGGGVFLLTFAQDVNHKQILIMATHVLANESHESWNLHHEHMRHAYTNARGVCPFIVKQWSIIGDGMRGIHSSFDEVFYHEAEHTRAKIAAATIATPLQVLVATQDPDEADPRPGEEDVAQQRDVSRLVRVKVPASKSEGDTFTITIDGHGWELEVPVDHRGGDDLRPGGVVPGRAVPRQYPLHGTVFPLSHRGRHFRRLPAVLRDLSVSGGR